MFRKFNNIPKVPSWALDVDGSRSGAEVALSSNDLVVVLGTQLEASPGPSVKVSTNIDGSAAALVLADGPELLEGRGAIDGWLVGTGADENVIVGAVDVDSSLLLGSARGVVSAEVLDDVVLDQGLAGPAVDGEIAVAIGLVGTRVRDGPARSVKSV